MGNGELGICFGGEGMGEGVDVESWNCAESK